MKLNLLTSLVFVFWIGNAYSERATARSIDLSDWFSSSWEHGASSLNSRTIFFEYVDDEANGRFSDAKAAALLVGLLTDDTHWIPDAMVELSQSSSEADEELLDWISDSPTVEELYSYLSYSGGVTFPIGLFRKFPGLLDETVFWGSYSDYSFSISGDDGVYSAIQSWDSTKLMSILFAIRGQDRSCNTGSKEAAIGKRLYLAQAGADVEAAKTLQNTVASKLLLSDTWIGIWRYYGAYERGLADSLQIELEAASNQLSEKISAFTHFDEAQSLQLANAYLRDLLGLMVEQIPGSYYAYWQTPEAMYASFNANDVDQFLEDSNPELLASVTARAFLNGDATTADRVLLYLIDRIGEFQARAGIAHILAGQNDSVFKSYIDSMTDEQLLSINDFSKSLAMIVAQYGHVDSLKALVARLGTNDLDTFTAQHVEYPDDCIPERLNRGVLSYAAEYGGRETIAYALKTFPGQILVADTSGRSPLDYILSNTLLSDSERNELNETASELSSDAGSARIIKSILDRYGPKNSSVHPSKKTIEAIPMKRLEAIVNEWYGVTPSAEIQTQHWHLPDRSDQSFESFVSRTYFVEAAEKFEAPEVECRQHDDRAELLFKTDGVKWLDLNRRNVGPAYSITLWDWYNTVAIQSAGQKFLWHGTPIMGRLNVEVNESLLEAITSSGEMQIYLEPNPLRVDGIMVSRDYKREFGIPPNFNVKANVKFDVSPEIKSCLIDTFNEQR